LTQTVLETVFSEQLDPGSVDATDFTHSLYPVTAAALTGTGATARITLNGIVPWDAASQIAFSAAAVVTDPELNPNVQTAAVVVGALSARVYLSGPSQTVIHSGAAPIDVSGLCDLLAGDLTGWSLRFVQGQGATRKTWDDGTTRELNTGVAPVTPEGVLGNFTPGIHAVAGLYRYTLLLRITFATGEAPLEVTRDIFVAADSPILGTVNDGLVGDADYQQSDDTLSANWFGFDQGVLPPDHYEWAVGTDIDPGTMEVFGWTAVGLQTAASVAGQSLTNGQVYYAFVRAMDAGGNVIGMNVSDGVTVDTEAPDAAGRVVYDGATVATDIDWQGSDRRIDANWTAFTDDLSGVQSYEWAVYQVVGAIDVGSAPAETDDIQVLAFTGVGNSTAASATFAAGTLTHDATYYAAVRSVDLVGNVSEVVASDGVTVDLLAPVLGDVRDGLVAPDVDIVNSGGNLSGNWDVATDPDSGVDKYEYRAVIGVENVSNGWIENATLAEGAMNTGRTRFGVVKLDAYRVMIIGGWRGTEALRSVEIFDARTGLSTEHDTPETGGLNEARFGFGAVLLPSGEVVVAGGNAFGRYVSSIEKWDPATGLWTTVPNNLVVPRENPAMVAFPDGRVWVMGGRGVDQADGDKGYLKSIEEFNLAGGVAPYILPGDELSETRASARAFHLLDGRLLVVGGKGPNGFSTRADLYDPTGGGGWFALDMTDARADFAGVILAGGDVLVFGGENDNGKLRTVERFHAATNAWTPVASMAVPRSHCAAAWLDSEDGVVVTGGVNDLLAAEATTELYDPWNDLWTAAADLNASRAYHRMVHFADGSTWIFGGFVNNGFGTATEKRVDPVPVSAWQETTATSAAINGLTLVDGQTYYFQVRAYDTVGNRSANSSSDGVLVDITAPTLEFTSTPDTVTASNDATFTVGGAGVVQYKYKLDAGAYGAATDVATAITLAGLADGAHTVSAIGVDAAGNWQAEAQATVFNWTVDSADLTAVINSSAAPATFTAPIPFTVEFNKDVTDFDLGDLTVTGGAAQEFTAVSAAEYTFKVQPGSRGGTVVTVSVAAGVAHDAGGKANTAATPLSVTYYTSALARVTLKAPENVVVGTPFDVEVYVKENSADANGFRGGAFDVQFTTGVARVDDSAGFDTDTIIQAPFTQVGTSGTLDNPNGRIDELGGATTADNLGEGELAGEAPEGVLYAVIPFKATASGTVTINAAAGQQGLSLTPPVGQLPAGAVDYGTPLVIDAAIGVTLEVTGGVTEVDEDGGTFTVRAVAGAAATEPITVALAFSGSATENQDYTPANTSLVIPAGSDHAETVVTALDDAIAEGAESVVVAIDSVASASGQYAEDGDQQVSVTITDDDSGAGDFTGGPGGTGDGKVDYNDLVFFIGCYGTSAGDGNYDARCDLDGDGDVDYYDLVQFIGVYGTDYNGRGARGPVRSEAVARATRAYVTLEGPTAPVAVGDTYQVKVYVEVTESAGFGAGAFDLTFNPALTSFSGTFDPADVIQPPYNAVITNGTLDAAAGLVDELGGFATTNGLGYGSPVLYAILTFKADVAGQAQFQAAAGESGFGVVSGGVIETSEIDYGPALTVTIAGQNRAPTAQPIEVGTDVDQAVDFDLAGTDPDGDAITFDLPASGDAGYPEHGTLAAARQGRDSTATYAVTYTPDAGFIGVDTFTFTVSDGELTSDPATVTVRVGGFVASLDVVRAGTPFLTMQFGAKPGASDGFDAADGDYPAPPSGVDGEQAYFLLSSGEKLSKDFRSLAAETTWQLVLKVPADSRETWQLNWDPSELPTGMYTALTPVDSSWNAIGAAVDMNAVNTLDVVNAGGDAATERFLLTVSDKFPVTYDLAEGWNLIGVPYDLDAANQAAILDSVDILAVFGWANGGGYGIPTTLEAGHGYWVYAAQATQIAVQGTVAAPGITLGAGWNLVGPTRDEADPSVGNAHVLAVWGWTPTHGYNNPDSGDPAPCKAGVGYWIYADQTETVWSAR